MKPRMTLSSIKVGDLRVDKMSYDELIDTVRLFCAEAPPELLREFIIDMTESFADDSASDEPKTRSLTANEFNKLQIYRRLLIRIMERDGTIEKFRGSTDYLLRSAIEALGLHELFYDLPMQERPGDESQ